MRDFVILMAAALWVFMAPLAHAAEAAGSARAAAHTGPLKPGPLSPGKSAGVRAAQQVRAGLALIGAGAIIAVVVVAAGSGGGGGSNGGQPNMQSVPTTTP